MFNPYRIFVAVELGTSTPLVNIKVFANDIVEVLDMTTRVVLHVKASEVSLYRHTLHWRGKSFNISRIVEIK